MPTLYDKISLGGIAMLILMFIVSWNEFTSWLLESLFGAVIATFFFSPLMSYLLGEERTVHEKTLFIIGVVLYVVFYLILADIHLFITYTLQGIALYSFVSAIVLLIYQTLAKRLP